MWAKFHSEFAIISDALSPSFVILKTGFFQTCFSLIEICKISFEESFFDWVEFKFNVDRLASRRVLKYLQDTHLAQAVFDHVSTEVVH